MKIPFQTTLNSHFFPFRWLFPGTKQLAQLCLFVAVPFFGFGFADNAWLGIEVSKLTSANQGGTVCTYLYIIFMYIYISISEYLYPGITYIYICTYIYNILSISMIFNCPSMIYIYIFRISIGEILSQASKDHDRLRGLHRCAVRRDVRPDHHGLSRCNGNEAKTTGGKGKRSGKSMEI